MTTRAHGTGCYSRGCRCDVGREAERLRRRRQRAGTRSGSPCGVCQRIHQGACSEEKTRQAAVTLTQRAHDLWMSIPHGQRSAWLARMLERELA